MAFFSAWTSAFWSKEVHIINPFNLEEIPKMKKQDIKPFVWGMAAGAVVLLIVIFSAGWVVTTGSAEAEAKAMASKAVMNRLAPIGVEQFMQDPNKEKRLVEMKKLDSWGENSRSNYVQKQGWATMPGEKIPDEEIADEVAIRLMDLKM
jgi:heme A synthase